MSPSSNPPPPDDQTLRLHAYLDGELDPVSALEFERRLAADPRLAAESEQIQALRSLLRARGRGEAPSPALRARIARDVGLRRAERRFPFWALAASIVLTASLAGGSTWLLLDANQLDAPAEAIVAAHIRGLMAPQPIDVASANSHTIKPWFAGRIPQAPRVIDLSSAGFSLAGGRVDVVDRAPVPTIVYRRREHVISVTEIMAQKGAPATAKRISANGYNIVRWTDDDVTYWAVSDLDGGELGAFVELFRASREAPRDP
ncbi:anti-sigma factor [Terrarubrum flagellatum]|uniref:anti-sigma factor family protein n=1 Tax=Terrirubrum flagellatum TaxID=2895980 RepID=UPI003144E81F